MTDKIEDWQRISGGPAFPSEEKVESGFTQTVYTFRGLTVRDYFVGKMLSGVPVVRRSAESNADLAKAAYDFADALIAEGNKRGEAP